MHQQRPLRAKAWLLLLIPTPLLAGCELVGDVFKLGVWSGVLMISLLAGLIFVVFRFLRRS